MRQKTDRRYEIIIVDDGSTDGSLKDMDSNGVRVIRQENQGPAVARNVGVEKAQGSIVLFTDGDCEPNEDWIEQMVRPLEGDSVSGVKGSYLTLQRGIVPRFVQLEYESKYEKMKKDRFIDFIDTYSAAFIKKDFLQVGKYDTRFPTASVEDQEFSFRMWKKGFRMVFNPHAKVYHTHSYSLWNYMKKKFKIGYWKALVLKDHPQKAVRDSHTPQLLKLEMAFALLFFGCLLLSLFHDNFLLYALFPLAGFSVTVLPLVLRLFRKDAMVALFSPLLLLVRAVSLSLGLMAGGWQFCLFNGRCGKQPAYGPKRKSAR
jgi:glycosyltransferase involved in cell wall biosynthesis